MSRVAVLSRRARVVAYRAHGFEEDAGFRDVMFSSQREGYDNTDNLFPVNLLEVADKADADSLYLPSLKIKQWWNTLATQTVPSDSYSYAHIPDNHNGHNIALALALSRFNNLQPAVTIDP